MAEPFHRYDIRGVYPQHVNKDIAYRIGRATVAFLGSDDLSIGHDMRVMAPEIRDAFAEGARDQGADVMLLGLCSTPLLCFDSAYTETDAVMITASHNPKEYCGMKIYRQGAEPVSMDTGLADIERLARSGTFPAAARKGRLFSDSSLNTYLENLWRRSGATHIRQGLTAVIDAGNGMAGLFAPHVFAPWVRQVIPMYFDLDGTFPNHEANPLKQETTRELCKRVVAEHADVGIAYDGDADRVFFVDEKGSRIPSESIACLLAEQYLKNKPGSRIVYSVNCSHSLRDTISAHGGIPVRERVGVALMKATMKTVRAIYGSEVSGHHTFSEFYNIDSADFCALMVLRIMDERGKRLSELVAPFARYAKTDELNFTGFADRAAMIAKIDELEKHYASSGALTDRLDGLTAEFPDWWCNIRPSNTEPILRAVVETYRPQDLAAKVTALTRRIRS